MKMVELLAKVAKGEIEDGAVIRYVNYRNEVVYYTYNDDEQTFYDKNRKTLNTRHEICASFLNLDAEYIPPQSIPYAIKLNIRGLKNIYVNLNKATNEIVLNDNFNNSQYQTHFSKAEMQNIQSLHEFLEDVAGKYEIFKTY